MKNQFNSNIKLWLILLLVFPSLATWAQGSARPDKWSLLGSRLVKHGLDRDEILVTASEGVYDAVQIRVKRAGINMHKCEVHFGDGSTQELEIRGDFKQGSQSRIINLEGKNRVIRKVVFWYDTKNYRKKQALIELWGKNIR